MLIDYHMHLQPDGPIPATFASRVAPHGGHRTLGWIGEYVERARSRGVTEIAITDHVYRFTAARAWFDAPYWQSECTEDLDAHVEALLAAKGAGLPVLVGLEVDWLAHRQEEIARLLEAYPFDVVLGSIHWIPSLGANSIDDPGWADWGGHTSVDVWSRYLDELEAAAGSGLFDVLAHPDLPKKFGARQPGELTERRQEVMRAIAASGVAIECSAAGLSKPIREAYPDPGWLADFNRLGVPVTLASDAHTPEDVARDYPSLVAMVRGAGYETITRFAGRTPEQVSIRWDA